MGIKAKLVRNMWKKRTIFVKIVWYHEIFADFSNNISFSGKFSLEICVRKYQMLVPTKQILAVYAKIWIFLTNKIRLFPRENSTDRLPYLCISSKNLFSLAKNGKIYKETRLKYLSYATFRKNENARLQSRLGYFQPFTVHGERVPKNARCLI